MYSLKATEPAYRPISGGQAQSSGTRGFFLTDNRAVAPIQMKNAGGPINEGVIQLGRKKSKKNKKDKKGKIISSNDKDTLILGTTHGIGGTDISGEIPEDMMQDAAVILEYPPLAGTGETSFSEATIKGISDKTQRSIAEKSGRTRDSHN